MNELPRNRFAASLNAGEVIYKPLVRACDDPRKNFERIRNQKLWAKKEAEKDKPRIASNEHLKQNLSVK